MVRLLLVIRIMRAKYLLKWNYKALAKFQKRHAHYNEKVKYLEGRLAYATITKVT